MNEMNPIRLSEMSGCLTGKVPMITDLNAAIINQVRVKILNGKTPLYGFVVSYNFATGMFDYQMASGGIIRNLSVEDFFIFSAEIENRNFVKGSSIIIDGELLTVVASSLSGLTVWVGNNNLVYYGEDVEAMIKQSKNYNMLGVVDSPYL